MSRRSRRNVIALLGTFLLVPTLFTVALSKTEGTPQLASLAGQLLVATAEMGDPNFRHAVVLMVRHDKTGALGIIINHPVEEVSLAKLMNLLGQRSTGITGQVTVFAGGPVERQIGFVVHSAEYRRQGTIDIDGRVAVTSNPVALTDICNHKGPQQSLVAFGYAGWSPGQLEGELAVGGWFTLPEDPKFVFDMDRGKLWDEMTKRRTYPL
jgi:putative transcriptional regulator